MLRSAFRGKQPADSTAKDEKQGKSAHGKTHFFFNRDHEGDANMNENLNTLVTEGVSYSTSEEELTIDYNHEFLEATQGSSSDKDSVNGEENMSKSLSTESGAEPDQEAIKTPRGSFSSSERQIYEMQLAQLQEQLVNTMIDYQDMSAQLEKLKAVDVNKLQKELQEEKAKNNELKEKLKQKHKSSSSKLQRKNASRMDPRHGHGMAADSSERGGDDWVDLAREEELHSSPASSHDTNGNAASGAHSPHEHDETSYDILDGVHAGHEELEQTAARSGEEESHRVQRVKTKLEMWKAQAVDLLLDRMWDFVNDEPETADEEDGEGEPLAVKTLKENINRFTASIKPITGFIKSVHKVFTWYNPTASFMIFLVYMYSVWHGFLFSLILFTMIWKLFMNYLHAKGIAKQLGFTEKPKEETPAEDHSWSDKFQLVLQVARKVQNTLGKMADSLEKIKSLLTWQHPEAARKLFTALCFALLASLALRGPTLFRLIGLSLGIKLFIVNPIYHRFPKVKRRYDGTAKLWRELPTDAELSARQTAAEASQEMPVRTSSVSSLSAPSTSSSEQSSSTSSNHVVEKFKLPSSEIILPGWEDGKRCALMNKDKPLSNVKHGRLFLTQSKFNWTGYGNEGRGTFGKMSKFKPNFSQGELKQFYLCFERSSSGKNIIIKLDTIISISKAKPIGIMPGTGMALELHVRGVEKPYIFGGIIGRDDVFESIKATGRAGNIPWALM